MTASSFDDQSNEQEMLKRVESSEPNTIRPVARDGHPPLSFAQERLWFLDCFEPRLPLYNVATLLRLRGDLDLGALGEALNAIVRRHEVLRTTYATVGGVPKQVIHPVLDLRPPLVDLEALGTPARRTQARRLARQEARQPFDLARGPVLRVTLLRLGAAEHHLLLTAHHIAFDSWSVGIFLRELAVLYRFFAGRASPLPDLPIQYADYAQWQREWLASEVLESQLAYWRRQLAELAVLELPTDRPRPAVQSFRGAVTTFRLPPALGRRLGELSREHGSTVFMTLVAAFQTLLGRYSGQQDLAVGSVVANRNRPEIENLVGFFANTLVLRCDLGGDPPFSQLLSRVRDVALGAFAHQDLPFEKLVEELEPARDLSRNPLVQVLFVLRNVPTADRQLAPGLAVHLGTTPTGEAKFDLTLALEEAAGDLRGDLEYNLDLFDPSTSRRLVRHYSTLLAAAVADPERRLGELPLMTPAEEQQLLREWSDTVTADPAATALSRLLEDQAARAPEATAVVLDQQALSYGELNRQAGGLAGHLREAGVGPETAVGIYLERSPAMVVAILAILKAGGIYVPLDPDYPPERVRYMVEDSRMPIVVTREGLVAELPAAAVRPLCLDAAGPRDHCPGGGPVVGTQLAYVLYTSGSTGRPKGVACNHRGVINLLADFTARAPLAAGDACSWWTSANFDVSVYEIFSALVAGGRLSIVPERARSEGERFVAWLASERIASAYVAPAMLPDLAAWIARRPGEIALRRLLVGVEPIPEPLLAAIRDGVAGLRVINGYGPTEATVCATLCNVRGVAAERTTPIGRPTRNGAIYLLDRHLAPVPMGVPGEVTIGGEGLARGYHHRPQFTAERFVPNPFSERCGERLYRTGDLARYHPDGSLDFLGRRDHQIKLRGFRIELGEVEAALVRHPGVREAVVVLRQERLVAYVVRSEEAPDAGGPELRSWLAERLPGYMVPAAVVLLKSLPLTPNRKVDRDALPAPEAELSAEIPAAPRNPLEEILAGIWCEVLGGPQPGIHDDFFALGGHSLLATQIASRVNAALGVAIGPMQLFERPTVAALAEELRRLAAAGAGAAAEPLVPVDRGAPLPLSFAQERQWFLQRLEPQGTAYNLAIPLELRGAADPEALRRALEEIVRRHEILRTTFNEQPGGGPVQRIAPPPALALPLIDLGALPEAGRRRETERLIRAEEGRPFDLEQGPLVRNALLRLAGDEHVLLVCCHHIVFDGWSMGVVVRELAVLYRFFAGEGARKAGGPLPELPIQYADFACWQRKWLSGPLLAAQLEWWRERLQAPPAGARLATDYPRPSDGASRAVRRDFALSAELSDALRRLSRQQGASLFMTLAAALQTLLHRHTGGETIVVGTPIANRNRPEIEDLIGFFVNTQVLRSDFGDDPTFRTLLGRMRDGTLQAYARQDLPFEQLVAALDPDRSTAAEALFQVLFALQNAPLPPLELPGVTLRLLPLERERKRTAMGDLSLGMIDDREGLRGILEYDGMVFSTATIDLLVEDFGHLLEEIVADPDRRVGALLPACGRERRRIGAAADGAAAARPEDRQAAAIATAERLRARAASQRERLSPAQRAMLAQRLRRRKGQVPAAARIPRRPAGEPAPPSFAQERLWFIDQMNPGTPEYNLPLQLRLGGSLALPCLTAAVNEIIRRHEVLRTSLTLVEDRPVQVIAPRSVLEPLVVDLAGLADPEQELRRLGRTEGGRPFDLGRAPLLRVLVVRLAADDHVVLFIFHHVVFDGGSTAILVRELTALYRALVEGRSAELPELAVQYADFAAWQRRQLSDQVLASQLEWWQERLRGAPQVLELPTDRPRPPIRSPRGNALPIRLPPPLGRELKQLCQRHETTLFMTLLAAFQVLLHRYTHQPELLVGSPVAGRNRAELEPLIGFFLNTLVLRADLTGDPTFTAFLGRVRETTLGAFAHQEVPFERLVDKLRPQRDLSRSPLFQVLFTLEQPVASSGLSVANVPAGTAQFDLALGLIETGSDLGGVVEYCSDLFDVTTVGRLIRHYQTLLGEVVRDPERPVAVLPLIAAAEKHQLVVEWNDGEVSRPPSRSLGELFAAQVERSPDRVAAIFEDQQLSYRELGLRVEGLSRHLRQRGVGPEVRVGVCAERSLELVVALLAVVRAGGAYLPLDPEYPPQRLAFMVDAAAPAVVLIQDAVAERLPETGAPRLNLSLTAGPTGEENRCREAKIHPDSPAYVIFTSGSTGQPKGCGNTHRAIVNRLLWMQDAYRLTAEDRVLQKTPFSFDVSVWEFFWPLITGACLVVARPGGHRDPVYLHRILREQRITTVHFVPSMLRSFLESSELAACPRLRRVIASGEALPGELRDRLAERLGTELYNLYGPTEAAVDVTSQPCATAGDGTVAIGRPIANLRIHLLDPALRPVPIGVAGELAIAGVGLGRGYHARPGLTAERFVPDPCAAVAGERIYRTGDLARHLADGRIEFLGRIDHQVKLRGLRIELGEIEAVLGRHPAVAEAVVVAREDDPGDQRLVAFLTAPAAQPEPSELRDFLAATLPEYMVPAAFVILEALPLTPNGKVDRRALLAREVTIASPGAVAPRTPLEEELVGMCRRLLKVEEIGVGDSFFHLGGHSLLVTQLFSQIRSRHQVELSLPAFFKTPTVESLARSIEEERLGRAGASPLVIRGDRGGIKRRLRRTSLPSTVTRMPRPPDGHLPLSFAQERLFFLSQLMPDNAAYNMPMAFRVRGALEVATLAAALREIVRRHESLRTRFAIREGQAVQIVAPASDAPGLAVVDLRGLREPDRGGAARRLVAGDARRPFALGRERLLRVFLVQLGGAESLLAINMHHVVSDGWSLGIFARELVGHYRALAQGQASPFPDLPCQYGDFALWQRKWLTPEALAEQLAYWRQRLEDASGTLTLPTDRPRPPVETFRGATAERGWPPGLYRKLEILARDHDVTFFMVLVAALDCVLYRHTGQEDLLVGTPIAGRNRAEIEDLIGFFVNSLVLRVDLAGDPPFDELLGRVREVTVGAYAHQDLPFERLVEEIRPQRNLSQSPLFQVMLALAPPPVTLWELPGLTLEPVPAESGTAKFDLTLEVARETIRLEYNRDLFDPTTGRRMLGHFLRLLAEIAAHPGRRASQFRVLSAGERHQVLVEWGRGAAAETSEATLVDLFDVAAARAPAARALVCGPQVVTYGELKRRADALARHLRRQGVGPEVRVAVRLERTPELVVAILAVLRAGGAYVPIDPAYPPERQQFMVRDSGAEVLLSREPMAAPGVPLLAPDRWPAGDEESHCPSSAAASNLAYVIYTSGSTGRPKGVAIEHRSAVALCRWAGEAFSAEELAATLAATSICFDLAIFELFVPLTRGATVVLVENVLALPSLPAAAVSLVNTVPSAMAELVASAGLGSSVRTVNLAGEPLRGSLVGEVYRCPRVARVLNLYGPSEDTTYSTWARIPRGAAVPAIGRPVTGTRACVLDTAGAPAAVGVPGELFLAGVGLARGYLDRPALTAERFGPDPASSIPGARRYRTGDRVRWRADGELEFLGRLDQQVKIRGFRIEPGEVEAVLAGHPEVEAAAVVAREDAAGDPQLVAYVTLAGPGGAAGPADLRAFLRARLPEHMVPAGLVVLEAFPLTPSGKIDRRALPAPDRQPAASVAPRTPVEELLAGIWAEVLGLEQVGIGDDFFDLGGHSLVANRVIARVRETFGVDLPLPKLFAATTVAALSAEIEALQREGFQAQEPPLVPVPRDGKPLPLSFAQRRLWFLDQLEPQSPAYNVFMAWQLEGDLDPEALGRAFAALVERHEPLRTRFDVVEEEPVQFILAPPPTPLCQVDLRRIDPAAGRRLVRVLAAAEADWPFDLRRAPLLRIVLIRLRADAWTLLMTVHHAVADGWSVHLLVHEMTVLYEAFTAGAASFLLPALAVQYADFAAWQGRYLSGEILSAELDYWRRRLGTAHPPLDLPADRPPGALRSDRGASVASFLSPELAAALRAMERRCGSTRFMILVAVLQLLLHRYTGHRAISVGTPISGRRRLETESIVGLFLNVLVLRTDLSGGTVNRDPTFEELTTRVREVILGAYAHQELPFEQLVQELSPQRDLRYTPLYQVLINYQSFSAPPPRPEMAARLRVRPVDLVTPRAKLDLTLHAAEHEGGVQLHWVYATDRFDRVRMVRMADHFANLLRACLASPGAPISALRFLSAAEAHQLLAEWNDTAVAEPASPVLHRLFERQVERTPDAVAVVAVGTATSYRELDLRAGLLAARLRRRGVGPGTVVGIHGEPAAERVVMALAVLKAGAACLPLDPAQPSERLAFMVGEAGAALVLSGRGASAPPLPGVDVLAGNSAGEEGAEELPSTDLAPDHAALILYTSGSTGRPKGVVLPHRLVASRLLWMQSIYGVGASDRVLHKASFGFDVAWWEVLLPLVSGGRVIIPRPGAKREQAHLAAAINAWRVTIVHFVPAALKVFLEAPEVAACRSLRLVLSGGETLPVVVKERFFALLGARLSNQYGMTETSIDVTFHPCAPGADPVRVPVGRPYGNTRLYLLDARRREVPIGVAGELCAGGESSAWGYPGRPGLTARRFVPDPFAAAPGARLYRSGDLARWRADGRLELVGRIDHQIKIRGVRIEPGEVEALLEQHPGVRAAAAVARRDEAGDLQLAACLVARGEEVPSFKQLRAWLGRRLPESMVPTLFTWVEALPLTASGKVDRAALPDPATAGGRGEGSVAARNPVELRLVAIWEQVLGVRPVGVSDDFFDLGGHSLMAVRLLAQVREQFGRTLPLVTLFQRPTVEQLAALLDEQAEPIGPWSPLVGIRPGRRETAPLFCVHPAGGTVVGYAPLARGLDGEQPFFGLQARGLEGEDEPFNRIEDMAACYLEAVRALRPRGPYFLAGWSMGGVVAFEMARRLRQQDEEVAFLALIDVWARALPSPADEDDAALLVAVLGEWLPLAVEELQGLEPDQQLAEVLRRAKEAGQLPPGYGLADARRHLDLYKVNTAARRAYTPPPYRGRIDLFRARQQPPHAPSDPTMGWGEVADQVEVHPVPGNHQSIVREPDVQELARSLSRRLARVRAAEAENVRPSPPDREQSPAGRRPP